MKQAVLADAVREGLEGVLASETLLSHVDGEHGRLIVAGHDVETLAATHSFEQAYARLLGLAQGADCDAQALAARLAEGRVQAFARLSSLGDALRAGDGMDALRAAVAHLPESSSGEQVVAAVAVYAAAWQQLQRGQAPIAPPAHASHAGALLAMLGGPSSGPRVQALEAYLVTVLDHGFNASTFAARVVASTRSDRVSAVVAAIGALKGPLHGGAPGPVLQMLDAIERPELARSYLEAELAAGRRIMGMGHRVYKQRDPRALVLERALTSLEQSAGDAAGNQQLRARLSLARSVEQTAEQLLEAKKPGRKLRANVEFYTAVLLAALDLPGGVFAPLFACGRSAGWVCHYLEQQRRGRLIRPSARYVGVTPTVV